MFTCLFTIYSLASLFLWLVKFWFKLHFIPILHPQKHNVPLRIVLVVVALRWAAPSEFGTYRLCEQRRFRRACASMQSCKNLRCSLIQAVNQEEPSTESQIPGPSEWLGMRSWNLSWQNARRHKFAWRGPGIYLYFSHQTNLTYFVLRQSCRFDKGRSGIKPRLHDRSSQLVVWNFFVSYSLLYETFLFHIVGLHSTTWYILLTYISPIFLLNHARMLTQPNLS